MLTRQHRSSQALSAQASSGRDAVAILEGIANASEVSIKGAAAVARAMQSTVRLPADTRVAASGGLAVRPQTCATTLDESDLAARQQHPARGLGSPLRVVRLKACCTQRQARGAPPAGACGCRVVWVADRNGRGWRSGWVAGGLALRSKITRLSAELASDAFCVLRCERFGVRMTASTVPTPQWIGRGQRRNSPLPAAAPRLSIGAR